MLPSIALLLALCSASSPEQLRAEGFTLVQTGADGSLVWERAMPREMQCGASGQCGSKSGMCGAGGCGLSQMGCSGGQCGSNRPSSPMGMMGGQKPTRLTPIEKDDEPATKPSGGATQPALDMDKLVATLVDKLAADGRFLGPPGPAGPPGERGAAGAPAAPVDYDKLAAEVVKRLPPVQVQTYDYQNRLVDHEAYPVGTPIKLRYGAVTAGSQ